MVCGMVLGAVALGKGEISQVEPLLATNLLFALALTRHRPTPWAARAGRASSCSRAGSRRSSWRASPRAATQVSQPLRHWLIIGIMIGLALLLTAYAKRSRMTAAPVLLALAAGLLYGVQDALTRVSGQRFGAGGFSELLTGWQPYGVLALGVTGLVLVQSAFETAELRMSLPALTAAQPLAESCAAWASSGTSCTRTWGHSPGKRRGSRRSWRESSCWACTPRCRRHRQAESVRNLQPH